MGDATQAYGGRLEKFHRHVIFVRPDYFVVIDDLESAEDASTWQWLFHAVNEMEVDDEQQVVISRSGDARLALRFLTPDNLEFLQITGFDQSTEATEVAPARCHVLASAA